MRLALALALVAALVGCTTVTRPTGVTGGAGTALADGGGPAAETAVGVTQTGRGGIDGSSGATPGGVARLGSASGPDRRSTEATAARASACKQVVKVGVSYSSDEGAALSAIGHPSPQAVNYFAQEEALYQRMADYVNANGGLAGCQMGLVFHDFKVLSADGFAAESQKECVDFAEDQHVFAAIPSVVENRTAITCLAQHQVVDIFDSVKYSPIPDEFRHYRGYLYQPDWLNPQRFRPFIQALNHAGYFGAGAKVGILLTDDGSGNNQYLVDNLWKPELQAMGITPVVFTSSEIEGYSDTSGATSQYQAAILQFKQNGVDHVMFTPDSGDGVLFFTQVADGQRFRPRYAMTSDNGPSLWSTAPAGQRPDAMAVSFSMSDLGTTPAAGQLATNPASANRARCDAIYTGHTSSSPVSLIYQYCDAVLFLQSALQGSSAVTPEALLAGADRLGKTLSLANDFSSADVRPPDHYDGGSSVRIMRWAEPAGQWQYASPVVPVS